MQKKTHPLVKALTVISALFIAGLVISALLDGNSTAKAAVKAPSIQEQTRALFAARAGQEFAAQNAGLTVSLHGEAQDELFVYAPSQNEDAVLSQIQRDKSFMRNMKKLGFREVTVDNGNGSPEYIPVA